MTGSIKAVEHPRTILTSSYGTANYTRYGNVVSVHADLNITSALSADAVIATGLPVPLDATNSYKVNQGFLVSATTTSRIYVGGDGKLKASSTSLTGYCAVQLTYICA